MDKTDEIKSKAMDKASSLKSTLDDKKEHAKQAILQHVKKEWKRKVEVELPIEGVLIYNY